MVQKATLQKESPKQSLPKVSSEDVHRCSSKEVFLETPQYSQENIFNTVYRVQHRCFLVNIAKFLRKAFLIENRLWHLWIFSS